MVGRTTPEEMSAGGIPICRYELAWLKADVPPMTIGSLTWVTALAGLLSGRPQFRDSGWRGSR